MTPAEKADAAKQVIEVIAGQTEDTNDLADILAMTARAILPNHAYAVIIELKQS